MLTAFSEALIENNIVVKTNKVIVARSSGAGSVIGYNYMDDGYIATDEGWIEIWLNASHMVGSHMVLFEGNQSFNIDSDDTHGNSTYKSSAAPLPNSPYLTCKPAFRGSNTWPWVDPTTGTTYTLPAEARLGVGTPNTVPATGHMCSP